MQRADKIILPLMVIAQLRAGFAVGKRGDENEQVLQRFLNSERVSIFSPNENTCYIYSRLFSYRRGSRSASHRFSNCKMSLRSVVRHPG